ncbi:hypothetical protein BH20ACT11_BH20ACT11_15370 [soil metagenome]
MKHLIRLTVEILERGTSRRARISAPDYHPEHPVGLRERLRHALTI